MNRSMKFIYCLILGFAIALATLPVHCEPLKATIQHQEHIDPVAPGLRAGSQFNKDELPKTNVNSKWFQIPRWMAGDWRRKEIFIKKLGRLQKSHKDVRQHRYGYQTDAQGNVWHWVRTPYRVVTEQHDTISYFMIKSEDILARTRNSVSIKITWVTWVVNKSTGVIKNVIQGVQVDTYSPRGDGALLADSDVANYNQLGTLTTRQNWVWKDDLMVYYEPIDNFKGINVKKLFFNYLLSRHLNNLIPRSIQN